MNNVQVFGQRMLFKLHDGDFIFDPPVFTGVIVSFSFSPFLTLFFNKSDLALYANVLQ